MKLWRGEAPIFLKKQQQKDGREGLGIFGQREEEGSSTINKKEAGGDTYGCRNGTRKKRA
eukprot:12885918-Prorocentrum_lima.AAC.1